MTQEKWTAAQIAEVLDKHAKWAHGEQSGSRANLSRANLSRADLYGADLSGANLSRAEGLDTNTIRRKQIVPERGAFEAFKLLKGSVVCRVRIPAEAGRVGGLMGRKCRAEFVEVLEGEGVSQHDGKTAYRVGEMVRPDKWDPNPVIECSHGIHFFLTEVEAREYS